MYAVIRTGGKQYRVAPGDIVDVDRLPGDAGASISFSEVLATAVKIGAPLVDGASVAAEILSQHRADRVVAFKRKRRKNTHRKRGDRQQLTRGNINSMSAGRHPHCRQKPWLTKKQAAHRVTAAIPTVNVWASSVTAENSSLPAISWYGSAAPKFMLGAMSQWERTTPCSPKLEARSSTG